MAVRPAALRPRRAAGGRARGVSIRGRELRLDQRNVPLFSGAVHYWRLAPNVWRAALRSLKTAGIPIVETYVPWDVHEVAEGNYDFGERNARNDVGAFIDLAAEEELWVIARPGPHINSEMTRFGIPERVIYDKACQARSPRQNPVILSFPPKMFPVPSYASSHYHGEVGRWYDAVGQQLAPRIFPNGPIVLLQVDNEAAYYFRNGPYDQDYHPDACRLWREFLDNRYGAIEAVADAHRARYREWEDVKPPERFAARAPDELVVHLDWAAFQEHLITYSLRRMKRRMVRAGMKGVPIIHNLPLGDGGLPVSVPEIEKTVDLVGFDYYHSAREHRTIKRRTLYLAGTLQFPYAPELGIGAPPWFTPLSHHDSIFCAMSALAYGLRGYNLYMWVDRDRWYGAPVDAEGTSRPEASDWAALQAALHRVDFHNLTRRVSVALMVPREYGRLSRATHLLGPFSPSTLEAIGGTPVDGCREDDLGFDGPIQVLWWRMLAKASDALTAAGIPYVYVDSDAEPTRLRGLEVIVSPTYEFVDRTRWARLVERAEEGVLIVYGPAQPRLDEQMRPYSPSPITGARRVLLDTRHDAEELIRELVDDRGLTPAFRCTPPPLEVALHEDAQGPRVLFLVNPSGNAVQAELQVPGPLILEDLLSNETFDVDDVASIHVEAASCRMLRVQMKSGVPQADTRPTTRPTARRAKRSRRKKA